jgi:hypothetical protein
LIISLWGEKDCEDVLAVGAANPGSGLLDQGAVNPESGMALFASDDHLINIQPLEKICLSIPQYAEVNQGNIWAQTYSETPNKG